MDKLHPETLKKLLYKDFKASSPERWHKIVTAVNFVRDQIHHDLAESNFTSVYGVSIFHLKNYFNKMHFSNPHQELDLFWDVGICKNIYQNFDIKWEHTVSLVSYLALGFENHSGIFLHPIKTLHKNPLLEQKYSPWEYKAGWDRRELCAYISRALSYVLDQNKINSTPLERKEVFHHE